MSLFFKNASIQLNFVTIGKMGTILGSKLDINGRWVALPYDSFTLKRAHAATFEHYQLIIRKSCGGIGAGTDSEGGFVVLLSPHPIGPIKGFPWASILGGVVLYITMSS